MHAQPSYDDAHWTSSGLARSEGIRQWCSWAADTIAPIDVTVYDTDHFAASWSSHGVGPLRLLNLHAPAQRVVHVGTDSSPGCAAPSIQLIYARKGPVRTRMAGKRFTVEPGQFVLLDNTRFYQMEMDTAHEAVDLMMPQDWLEKYLPDPDELLARPTSAKQGWNALLGCLIETMATNLDSSPLPRPFLAEQVGVLLTLATARYEPANNRHRGKLARQILRRIEVDFADPDLSSDRIADDLGISRRYLQVLLAGMGTSFVQELNKTRLDRASDLLNDARARGLSLGDVAFRCGFLDPGYFTRLFRKRFGMTPSVWRTGRGPG